MIFGSTAVIKAVMPFLLFFLLGYFACAYAWPVTALVPSQPSIEGKKRPEAKKQTAQILDEIDMLMALLEPFDHIGLDMEMPQFFGSKRYPANFDPSGEGPELTNLLGDVEEIRYLDKKAWGANVALPDPGLYQFVLEARPWWNEDKKMYMHQQAKVLLPVLGVENGWNVSFGQSFEILPLNRPFGLTAPALFSGRVLLDGNPLADIAVHMGRINPGSATAITQWHKFLEARTDDDGQFSFVLSEPGWWYCEAAIRGAPLKGPDGEMRELERSTVFWLYVDAPAEVKGRK